MGGGTIEGGGWYWWSDLAPYRGSIAILSRSRGEVGGAAPAGPGRPANQRPAGRPISARRGPAGPGPRGRGGGLRRMFPTVASE